MRLNDDRREDLFWMQVERTATCWLWQGLTNDDGYGRIAWHGKTVMTHRRSWEMEFGAIPMGFVIDHICRNRSCVRPLHLRLATSKENAENRGIASPGSVSGFRGVTYVKSRKRLKRYRARVKHLGKWYSGGFYATAEEAQVAVRDLRLRLFTHNFSDAFESDTEAH